MEMSAGTNNKMNIVNTGKTDAGGTNAGMTSTGKTNAGTTSTGKTNAGKTDAGKTNTGMNSKINVLVVFIKKEIIEHWRSYRIIVLLSVLLLFGMSSPLIAKLVPVIFESIDMGIEINIPEPTFIDVDIEDKNFDYIEEVNKRNIMVGIEEDIFAPDAPLTRVEAYTVVSRILGLQNLIPIGNYSIGYRDEANIPSWAKGHVYICKELGLIEESDYLYPNRYLTKGEAAKLIVNLINYMQEELRYDYMEGILNN